MASRYSGSAFRGVGSLLAVTALSLAAIVPVQAATVSATGALSITITGPDSLTLGVASPISIVVTNTSGSVAQGSLGSSTPIGAKLSGLTATGALCTNIGGGNGALVFCELPSLAPGASATINFKITATQLGRVDIPASSSDSVNVITVADLSMPVVPSPTDVQVTGSASTGSPTLDAVYSYTFQVKNSGPWPAPAVTFADTLPASLSFVGVTSSAGSCSQAAGSVNCAFGDMAVGSQANVVISVQTPATAQTITDTASVAEGVPDRQPANNNVSVTVQVK